MGSLSRRIDELSALAEGQRRTLERDGSAKSARALVLEAQLSQGAARERELQDRVRPPAAAAARGLPPPPGPLARARAQIAARRAAG